MKALGLKGATTDVSWLCVEYGCAYGPEGHRRFLLPVRAAAGARDARASCSRGTRELRGLRLLYAGVFVFTHVQL